MIGPGIGLSRGARVESRAMRDLRAYAKLVTDSGRVLTDNERGELLAFATALYSAYGRTDFTDLKRNVGTGSVAYSFHGVALTLTNSAAWASGGIDITTAGVNSGALSFGNASMLPAKTFFSVATPVTQVTLGISMLHSEGPTNADVEITQSYRVSASALNPYIYTSGGFHTTSEAIGAATGQILSTGFSHPASSTVRFHKNGVNQSSKTLPGNTALNPVTAITRFFRPLQGARIIGAFVICDKDKAMDAAALHTLVKTHLFPTLP